MLGDLTTLPAVRDWLGLPAGGNGPAEKIIARLITACSAQLLAYINLPTVLYRPVTELRDGTGGNRLVLAQYPVGVVSSVSVGGIPAIASTDGFSSGYVLTESGEFPPGRPQVITLLGAIFPRASANVSLSYMAGYRVVDEALGAIPAAGPTTLAAVAPYGPWTEDLGLKLSTGVALTRVNGTPAGGQYAVVADQPGIYKFATADIGKSVLATYGYVPAPLEAACVEFVAERYKYKDRIGHRSKTLAQNETIAYENEAVPKFVRMAVSNYRRVLPI